MDKQKIIQLSPARYSEKKIVELFGTPKQQESYAQNGCLATRSKTSILEKASRYCKITDLGNKNYSISKIYKYPLPSKWSLMNKTLYKDLVPLLLHNLINGHDENNAITLTIGKWARELKMINSNYPLIKSNKEDAATLLDMDLDTIFDFYNKADAAMEYYIINALTFLKNALCIYWLQVHYVVVEITDNTNTIDENGNITPNIRLETRLASEEEVEYYVRCMEVADNAVHIENISERYYSKKSEEWNRILKKELYKRKIKLVYKAYKAYYVHLDRCQYLLEQFEPKTQEELHTELIEDFTKHIMENSEKRYKKTPDKYDASYCEYFAGLCDVVINPKTEFLGGSIQYKSSTKEPK